MIKGKIRKHFELTENENTTYQKLWVLKNQYLAGIYSSKSLVREKKKKKAKGLKSMGQFLP